MTQKLVNLVALLSVALVACTFGAQPATALAAHGAHGHLNRAEHHAVAVKKQRRSDASHSRRCRKRPSSSASLAHPTSSASYSSAKATSTSDAASTATSDVASTATSAAVSTSDAASSSEVVSSSSAKKTSSTSEAASTTQAQPTHTEAPPPPPPATTHTTHSSSETHTSTSSSAPPAKSPGGGGGASGPGKIGLAWPPGQTGLAPYINDNVKYLYSWRAEIVPEAFQYNINCIPMMWGPEQADDFVANAEKNVKGNWMAFLNEPNQSGQSDISAKDAASLYWRSMKQFQDKGYDIIAPATSSAPDGFQWVIDFFNYCGDQCEFKAIALHYYGTNPTEFIAYIEKWHNQWPDKQVFVTEFACENYNTGYENNGQQCSDDQVWNYWSTAIKYMEAQPWITAYFGFGVMRDMSGVNPANQLMVPSTGKPTTLGYKYLEQSW